MTRGTCFLFVLLLLAAVPSLAFAVDTDGDGADDAADCQPSNPGIFPAQAEVCDDGIDQDCDTFVDSDDPECQYTGVATTGGPTRDVVIQGCSGCAVEPALLAACGTDAKCLRARSDWDACAAKVDACIPTGGVTGRYWDVKENTCVVPDGSRWDPAIPAVMTDPIDQYAQDMRNALWARSQSTRENTNGLASLRAVLDGTEATDTEPAQPGLVTRVSGVEGTVSGLSSSVSGLSSEVSGFSGQVSDLDGRFDGFEDAYEEGLEAQGRVDTGQNDAIGSNAETIGGLIEVTGERWEKDAEHERAQDSAIGDAVSDAADAVERSEETARHGLTFEFKLDWAMLGQSRLALSDRSVTNERSSFGMGPAFGLSAGYVLDDLRVGAGVSFIPYGMPDGNIAGFDFSPDVHVLGRIRKGGDRTRHEFGGGFAYVQNTTRSLADPASRASLFGGFAAYRAALSSGTRLAAALETRLGVYGGHVAWRASGSDDRTSNPDVQVLWTIGVRLGVQPKGAR